MEELARHRCRRDDGSAVIVTEQCFVFLERGEFGTRRRRGAASVTMTDGEPVRYIDASTFEVVATGELLTRDALRADRAGHG